MTSNWPREVFGELMGVVTCKELRKNHKEMRRVAYILIGLLFAAASPTSIIIDSLWALPNGKLDHHTIHDKVSLNRQDSITDGTSPQINSSQRRKESVLTTDALKQEIGKAAAKRVESNSIIGLGSGSTTAFAIQYVGERLQKRELTNVIGVATSFQAEILAREHGIPVARLGDINHIDLAIDGADEVNAEKNLIKGAGAAHSQEKIIASLADFFLVVVDGSKVVGRLGSRSPLPVEVIPIAAYPVMKALERLGGQPEIRMGIKKVGPVVTDHGNFVIDVRFREIADPGELEKTINNIPGVLDNGLFVGLADLILVGEVTNGRAVISEIR